MLHLRARTVAAAAVVLSMLVGPAVAPASAQDAGGRDGDPNKTTPLEATGRREGSKAPSSRLAESDAELLARQDGTRVPVLVKLDYDSIATYRGGSDGAPATSPSATGRPLTRTDATRSPYARQVATRETQIVDDIRAAVPQASIGRSLRVVFGGVAAVVPANRADDLLAVDGVVAVQGDEQRQLLTDSSTDFINAPPVWATQGGQALAGHGVLYGSLDTGIWPEHPSFADNPALGPAPTDNNGDPIVCDFGDNPLTGPVDVYACNSKLVGGQPFLDTYNAVVGGEFYPDSARDSDGHGTHTASTSAGSIVASAEIFGVERGPISGVAPGAWVASYKVCGTEGCFGSDSAAAVEAAILDGVDVINFSISGGSDPFSDPVELAFLDAYAASVFVAASAGNSGPDPSTADHLSPWVTTVAASTQTREFGSTLTLTSPDGPDLDLEGVSIGTGIDTSLPVVRADEVEGYSDPGCLEEPAASDTFAGLIVACERGPGRVARGHNVFLGGGAAMVLHNPTLADVETDNHFLPVIHLADGAELVAYLDDHSHVEGTFTAGEAREGQGDAMASFSSRGPAGRFLKPDVTAPGVQILAGHTPTPDTVDVGPPGEYFQAIAGTSMSSPHVAGAAILLDAAHPDWTPGQIKSALMTTATTAVVKEDLATPADPFDMGSGRIDVGTALNPGLTIADEADRFFALSGSPLTAIDVNVPSINAPVVPGRVTTTRVVKNVGSGSAVYTASPTAPPGTSITVTPNRFTIAPGATRTITITISADGAEGQQFGAIALTAAGRTPLHLPVAFVPGQGEVSLTSDCSPEDIEVGSTPTSCTVTASNEAFADAPVEITTTVDDRLSITDASSGDFDSESASLETVLAGRVPGDPSLEAFGPEDGGVGFGYVPLDVLVPDIEPIAISDEEAIDFETQPFMFNGVTYSSFSIISNGYIVAGEPATSADIQCCPPQQLPNPSPPNNVLAPFWADLTGDGSLEPAPDGILAAEVTFGPTQYTVIEFRLNGFGTDDLHIFQVWIGHNGVQDITFDYDPATTDLDGIVGGLTIGAENELGTGGDQLDATPEDDDLPEFDLAVVSTDPEPGDSVSLVVEAEGVGPGTGVVHSELVSPVVPGVTAVDSEVQVILPTSDVEAFVAQAFVDFLGRNPSQSRLDFWTQRIQGGAPRSELLAGLVGGDEYRGLVVDKVFQDLINRQPTATERTKWITELRAGGLAEARLVAFVGGSNAFKVLAGGTTGGYVDRIHQEVLGRDPSPARRAFWVNEINSGTPRSELAYLMYQSQESRKRRVRSLYARLLDRAPAAGFLQARADVLRSNPDGTVGAALAASDEYFQKAQ